MTQQRKKKGLPIAINYEGAFAPFDETLEMSVLGTILLQTSAIDEVSQDFKAQLFYKIEHQMIANAILQLYTESAKIDILTVTERLRKNMTLQKVGGPGYIARLTNLIASTANFEYHVKLLQEFCLKRNIIEACSLGTKKALDPSQDAFDVMHEVQTHLDDSLKGVIHYEAKPVGVIHDNLVKESIEIAATGQKSGVPCGLRMVDNVTNGWQKTDMIIFAGRPGMGKSAAAVAMAMYPAIEQNIPIGLFSLEMSEQQIVARMQSCLSGINAGRIVKKQLYHDEIEAIAVTGEPLRNAPIYIDDTPSISLLYLKGKARKLVKDKGVRLIIIDYLQLMRSGLNIENREQEISEISKGIKALAKELDVPIIALSQLSRAVEARGGDKKPLLSDLRESGQIEQDADMVVFCYRPEYYGIADYEVDNETFDTKGLFMFLIAKNRNGSLGEIPLTFIHEQTKLVNHSYNNNYVTSEQNRTFVQQEGVQPTNETSSSVHGSQNFDQDTGAPEEVPF